MRCLRIGGDRMNESNVPVSSPESLSSCQDMQLESQFEFNLMQVNM